jgi:hypothetical protein
MNQDKWKNDSKIKSMKQDKWKNNYKIKSMIQDKWKNDSKIKSMKQEKWKNISKIKSMKMWYLVHFAMSWIQTHNFSEKIALHFTHKKILIKKKKKSHKPIKL